MASTKRRSGVLVPDDRERGKRARHSAPCSPQDSDVDNDDVMDIASNSNSRSNSRRARSGKRGDSPLRASGARSTRVSMPSDSSVVTWHPSSRTHAPLPASATRLGLASSLPSDQPAPRAPGIVLAGVREPATSASLSGGARSSDVSSASELRRLYANDGGIGVSADWRDSDPSLASLYTNTGPSAAEHMARITSRNRQQQHDRRSVATVPAMVTRRSGPHQREVAAAAVPSLSLPSQPSQPRTQSGLATTPVRKEPLSTPLAGFHMETDESLDAVTPLPSATPGRVPSAPAINAVDALDRDVVVSMRDRETFYRAEVNYLQWHPDISHNMRAMLFDWLIEVCEEYRMHRQTLHWAYSYIDRYLSCTSKVSKNKLQLIGVACLLIASKLEEIYPPKLDDFVYVTNDAYTVAQLSQMEHVVLKALNWDLYPYTINCWIASYLRAASRLLKLRCIESKQREQIKAGQPVQARDSDAEIAEPEFPHKLYVMMMRLADATQLHMGHLSFSPSLLAASILRLHVTDDSVVAAATHYDPPRLQQCISWLDQFLDMPNPSYPPDDEDRPPAPTGPFYYQYQTHHPQQLAFVQSLPDFQSS